MKRESNNVLFALYNVTIRVHDKHILQGSTWEIHEGEHWAVMGPNGSGKTSLVRALVDEYAITAGSTQRSPALSRPHAIGYISFEQQQDLINHREQAIEAFHFSGLYNNRLTVENVLFNAGEKRGDTARSSATPFISPRASNPASAAKLQQLWPGTLLREELLKREVASLSNGEIRRTLIARAVLRDPCLLILDEPFEGIDPHGREQLHKMIRAIIESGRTTVVLVTNRTEQLTEEIPLLLCVQDGTIVFQGKKEDYLQSETFHNVYENPEISTFQTGRSGDEEADGPFFVPPLSDGEQTDNGDGVTKRDHSSTDDLFAKPVIEMKDVTIGYSGSVVLRGFNWQVLPGENWIITGENGSGKTSLLKLIHGDHPQAYANEVIVFGKRRGPNQPLWELRKRIGYLSTELHMHYRKNVPIEEVVLSGFYDSVGLFSGPPPEQIEKAGRWLKALGFFERKSTPLAHFSYGEQRLVLLARAMIKSPRLLILDEPLQGLDPWNRTRFFKIIEAVGTKRLPNDRSQEHTTNQARQHTSVQTQILLVTHHGEELPPCFHKKLTLYREDLPASSSDTFSYAVESLISETSQNTDDTPH